MTKLNIVKLESVILVLAILSVFKDIKTVISLTLEKLDFWYKIIEITCLPNISYIKGKTLKTP